MVKSWQKALEAYSYPVDLTKYRNAKQFPGFFNTKITGDRASTMDFERHYRDTASTRIEPYLEVIYWKLCSLRRGIADREVDNRLKAIRDNNTTPQRLWHVIQQFIGNQTEDNLERIWEKFGYSDNGLALPLTFPALAGSETLPMIDMQVANWVNKNLERHNDNRISKLTLFNTSASSLRGTDKNFVSYVNWVHWCQEVSTVLTKLSAIPWRVRDVEMAVYTAERSEGKLDLEPLPKLKC
jgi:hypothetical protein